MIIIIAALAANRVIGKDEGIPFYLPDDLTRFKEATMGHTVVQGPKTLNSIVKRLGKPLPGRENIVLTHHPDRIRVDGVKTIGEWWRIVEMSRYRDVFVIGGAELYKTALPDAQEMRLTRVHAEVEGDTLFPIWRKEDWMLVSSESPDQGKNGFPFTWETYWRRSR
nr:Dihydrofolate reductase [uncultured bacterium]